MTDTLRRFIVRKTDDGFKVRVSTDADPISRFVAGHKNLNAIRVAIPGTHVKANVPVEDPIVEVWINKKVAPGFGGDRRVHI